MLGAGCRSASEQFREGAERRGLSAEVVMGAPFSHLVLSFPRPSGRRLHIYLDGDGTPSLGGYPAVDPTPRDPLVLDLMTLDAASAVYVGRPCYHGLGNAACVPTLWTSGRYSEPVVASMAAAVRRVIEARGATQIVWMGYSGGGVLAALLSTRVAETVGLVTIAANLDIDAWADLHGMPRLVESLHPARQPAPARGLFQRHYAGGRDRIVPVPITRQGAAPTAEIVVIADYDHRCCWTTLWPTILNTLDRALPPPN